MAENIQKRVIVALDFPSEGKALDLVRGLDPARCRLKIGKELFTRYGPAIVEKLVNKGFDVFLDLKFHDIPRTVAQACKAAASLGVWMMNVHATGGRRMMEAAREALEKDTHRPLLIAVTLLTSLDENDLHEIGFQGGVSDTAIHLALLARQAGIDGAVCSPHELVSMRRAHDGEFFLVTPGIRPKGTPQGDQKRTMTPCAALRGGADYLVIGRPITEAPDPLAALRSIEAEIEKTLA